MGGKVCMKLASMYPEIFDELILLESAVGKTKYEPADLILDFMHDLEKMKLPLDLAI